MEEIFVIWIIAVFVGLIVFIWHKNDNTENYNKEAKAQDNKEIGGQVQAKPEPLENKYSKTTLDGVKTTTVVVSDISMSFEAIIKFMVKWAIASIPAMFILAIPVIIIGNILESLFSK